MEYERKEVGMRGIGIRRGQGAKVFTLEGVEDITLAGGGALAHLHPLTLVAGGLGHIALRRPADSPCVSWRPLSDANDVNPGTASWSSRTACPAKHP